MSAKFTVEVSLSLLEEMAWCIQDCEGKWADGEMYAYMKSTILDNESYDPEDWK